MKIVQQMGIDAQVLIKLLEKTEVGEFASYGELSEAIGRDVTKDGRCSLMTARNRLMRDQGMIFGTVRGQGLTRLDEAEKLGVAQSYVTAINKKSRKGLTVLAATEFSKLDNERRQRHNLLASHLGVLSAVTTEKAQKKIEARVANDGLVPTSIALELLK